MAPFCMIFAIRIGAHLTCYFDYAFVTVSRKIDNMLIFNDRKLFFQPSRYLVPVSSK
jgi:hypothetical protein